MSEREPAREIIGFHEEIKKVKSADKTLFALNDPENLDEGSMELWKSLKLVFEFGDPKEMVEACDEMNDLCLVEVKKNSNTDKTEFVSWMRNKLAALKSTAEYAAEGKMDAAEFSEEVGLIKVSFAK